MRYFYADSIDAAYMMRHFGMRFPMQGKQKIGFYQLVTLAIHVTPIHGQSRPRRYYMSENSQLMLAPQPGDIITQGSAVYIFSSRTAGMIGFEHDRLARIIARGGVPFLWPERENA